MYCINSNNAVQYEQIQNLVREDDFMSKSITMRIDDNLAYLAKLDMAIEDAREHGVYEYLGKDENGKAKFSDTPHKAAI